MGHQENLLNFELLNIAKGTAGHHKVAFVPSSDPSMGAGGGGAPPGGDPSGGGGMPPGGAPPMDPSMMGGGAPPPPPGGDPSGGGGGAGLDAIMQKLNQLTMMGQGGAGGAGGAGGLKPKIDQNMVSVQILKTLARICDHLGIHVPMSDMVPGMGDLNQLAQATQGQAPMPGAGGGGGDPSGGGGAPGAIGGMPPMDPMQGAGQPGMAPKTGSYRGNGVAFDTGGFIELANRAEAIAAMRRLKI
jgi:hypothetical protein